MANKLGAETSPYLRQHADNPVDWYPWGPEALARAKTENKPILLSVGYAACHWCHVMAHESFENADTAALMNEHFVNIKVDREERPDIDSIYMQAVQTMTGQGGWPMTVFLFPDGTPFYGGTYFPPEDRQGMPSFQRILRSVAEAYRDKPDALKQTAAEVAVRLRGANQSAEGGSVDAATLEQAYRGLARTFDVKHAGFGTAPKFPPSMSLQFLLRHWSRTGEPYAMDMVRQTFRAMIRGGIYDQVGGGMARYSTDATWLVPHFEKMLYDNALLIQLGVHLWQATHDEEVRSAVARTVAWVAREMTSPDGGFYSSLDADSEGEEGRFYLWSEAELDAALGADAALIKSFLGVSASGNFEGRNIFNVRDNPAVTASRYNIPLEEFSRHIDAAREKLYAIRAKRVWPARDEKILAGWNGLMLRAIATAARVFDGADWRELALRNARFIQDRISRDGRVTRSYKEGMAGAGGFLEDHAAVGLAFIAVYEMTFEHLWLDRAREITDAMLSAFWDPDEKKLYDTAKDAEQLIVRPRDVTDNALPSGSSMAAELLLRLGDLYDDQRYRDVADEIIRDSSALLLRYPAAFGHLLGAVDMQVNGCVEIALVGNPGAADFGELTAALAARYVPSLVLAGGEEDSASIALLRDRTRIAGKATAYVCRNYACEGPVTDAETFSAKLDSLSHAVNGGSQ